MQSGLGTTISLTNEWRNDTRGASLHNSDFDTNLLDRTGGKKLAAVLVLPVAVQSGSDAGGGLVAEYPLFAPVAVDADGLAGMRSSGMAAPANIHQTISDAARRAEALNAASQKAYQDHYAAGRLIAVARWTRIAAETRPGIAVGPAANSGVSQQSRRIS